MAPASHVRLATVQVRAMAALTEVEDVLPEETIAIRRFMPSVLATCTYNSPFVSSIETFVPEQHPSCTTMLKHLKSHKMPPSSKMLGGLLIAPAVQAIVVDCVPIVNPQLAPIIGENAEAVIACLEDSQTACPTHGKVIASAKTGPSATCVAIVHHLEGLFVLAKNRLGQGSIWTPSQFFLYIQIFI